MKIRKSILFLSVFLLLMPMFLGATGTQPEDEAEVEMEPLTYFVGNPASSKPHEINQLMYQEWMKATGVKIEIIPIGTSGIRQKIMTTVASGDLEDMMVTIDSVANPYGMQGAFAAINEYFDIAPNLKRHFSIDANPWMYAPDGNLYQLPSSKYPYLQMGWQWRQDWADRLGISTPKTVDDWAAAWRKVKQDDPESVPWMTLGEEAQWQFLCHAWGIGGTWSAKYTFENGEFKYPFVTEKMKEVVTFLRDMYAEGLMWQEYLKYTAEMRDAMFAKDKVFSFSYYQSGAFNLASTTQEMRDNTVPVAPPVGPYGDSGCDWLGVTSFYGTSISSTCKNIPAAIKLLDYIYSDEGYRLWLWGKEGVTFEYAPDGTMQFTEKVKQEAIDAGKALGVHLGYKYGLDLSQSLGGGPWGTIKQIEHAIASDQPWGFVQGQAMVGLHLGPLNPPVWNTKEEGERLTALRTDVETYRKEMTAKFIVGQEPLTRWDEYVKSLERLGYKELEELLNKGYERYLEKVGKPKGYAPKVEFDTSGLKEMVGLK